MNTSKSIWAVVAGFIVVVVLSTGTDAILHATGVTPAGITYDTAPLALALLYRTLYTILGGYVVARLAPGKSMKHVIIFGIIGMVLGILGAIAGRDLGPAWYPWGIVVLSIPSVWVGAKLYLYCSKDSRKK